LDTALISALSTTAGHEAEGIAAEAFDHIVGQHQRRIYRVILLLLRDADAADTLTQECFLRAYNSRKKFRGECSIGTWLVRIAVNLARDHGKSRRTSFWKKLVGLDDAQNGKASAFTAPQPSAERVLLAHEELQAVWDAIGQLSPQQRTIFLLRFVEEMPLAEIAQTLGLRVGSVKAQLCRATGKIRETVKEK
jgi:RNA polymerase sigma-70 factor (ECF subfamily)